jgi:hypothetical protein
MAKGKRTNNDLQNITQKTKARATRTHKKSGVTLEYICWMNKSFEDAKGGNQKP